MECLAKKAKIAAVMTKTPQFQVSAAQAEDEQRVIEILASAAEAFHLLDTKVTSRAENTICLYAEGRGFEFGLGAWRAGDRIVIAFNPGKGGHEQFFAVFDLVVTQLRTAFGDRFATATPQNYVDVPNTLPQTDAARAIYRTLLKKTDTK